MSVMLSAGLAQLQPARNPSSQQSEDVLKHTVLRKVRGSLTQAMLVVSWTKIDESEDVMSLYSGHGKDELDKDISSAPTTMCRA